jgi:Flp pilus assembly protein TadG
MTEFTLVMMLFFVLVFGMIDLAILITRSQSLAQAARVGARAAVVRGEYANILGSVGPTAYSGTAAASHPVADALRGQLILMNPANVTLNVTWADGNNAVDSRVRVRLTANFTPLMTFIFGAPTWTLTGASEMTIAH